MGRHPILKQIIIIQSILILLIILYESLADQPMPYRITVMTTPEVLQQQLDDGFDVYTPDASWMTPLHRAAKYNTNPEIAKMLIEAGADINAKDSWNRTPLHFATEARNKKVADFLVSSGADTTVLDHRGNLPLDDPLRLR